MAHVSWVLKHMCIHYFKQVACTYIPISAYHMHIKHGQTCMIMPTADCLRMARPSSVLY